MSEKRAYTIQVFGSGCIGVQRQNEAHPTAPVNVMIAWQDEADTAQIKEIHDLFLTRKQAVALCEDLTRILISTAEGGDE